MAYVPKNIEMFLAAFSGALSAMGASDRQPKEPSAVTAHNIDVAAVAGSYAIEFDTIWGLTPTTSYDVSLAESLSQDVWSSRGPSSGQSITLLTPTTYTVLATAVVALIKAGENYLVGQAIVPPPPLVSIVHFEEGGALVVDSDTLNAVGPVGTITNVGGVATLNLPAIVDAVVAAGAAIAGTKVTPAFGAQNISTSGTLGAGAATLTSITDSGLGLGVVHSSAGGLFSSSLIVDADVAAGAAIAGSKVTPAFGAQNISTSGTLGAGAATLTSITDSGLGLGIVHSSAGGLFSSSTIVDADVAAAAAIAGTKIAPAFGAQNISTSGTLGAGAATLTSITDSGLGLGIVHSSAGGLFSSSTIVDADVAAAAAIAGTKIAPAFGAQNISNTNSRITRALGTSFESRDDGATVSTVDGTLTQIYADGDQAASSTYDYEVTVCGQAPATGDMLRADFSFNAQRIVAAATTFAGPSPVPLNIRSTGAGNTWGGIAVILSGNGIEVTVTGLAATNINWSMQVNRLRNA
jgi:hypothetical protein